MFLYAIKFPQWETLLNFVHDNGKDKQRLKFNRKVKHPPGFIREHLLIDMDFIRKSVQERYNFKKKTHFIIENVGQLLGDVRMTSY